MPWHGLISHWFNVPEMTLIQNWTYIVAGSAWVLPRPHRTPDIKDYFLVLVFIYTYLGPTKHLLVPHKIVKGKILSSRWCSYFSGCLATTGPSGPAPTSLAHRSPPHWQDHEDFSFLLLIQGASNLSIIYLLSCNKHQLENLFGDGLRKRRATTSIRQVCVVKAR